MAGIHSDCSTCEINIDKRCYMYLTDLFCLDFVCLQSHCVCLFCLKLYIMCSEYVWTAKTVNCYNYSYFVSLSLVKSCFYSVFLLPFCGEIKLCKTNLELKPCWCSRAAHLRPSLSWTCDICLRRPALHRAAGSDDPDRNKNSCRQLTSCRSNLASGSIAVGHTSSSSSSFYLPNNTTVCTVGGVVQW